MNWYSTLPERLVPFNFCPVPTARKDKPLAWSVIPQERSVTHVFHRAVLAGIPLLAVEANDDTLAQEEGSPHDHVPDRPFPTVIKDEVEDHWKEVKREASFRNKLRIKESKINWFCWIFPSLHFTSGATRLLREVSTVQENLIMLSSRANTMSWFWHLLPISLPTSWPSCMPLGINIVCVTLVTKTCWQRWPRVY